LKHQLEDVNSLNERLRADTKLLDTFPEREGSFIKEIEEIKDKLEKEERALSEERLRIEQKRAGEFDFFESEEKLISSIKENITKTELETKEEMEKFEYEKSEQLKH
jgi:hypothetical protein